MSMTDYSATTFGIRVSVVPTVLTAESYPESSVYAFAYTVTIENLGEKTCQLLERHWVVVSDGEPLTEITGPGVVGEQPTLAPGESFTYTSSAVIEDPVGEMHGTYTFRGEDDEFFEVTIPRFDLRFAEVVH